ncbi:MAG: sigma-54 dependent transcriptional regulator [Candidatus Krumholzibacteriota bacterium]
MKPLILVIDDEEAIRLFLAATLEDEGYEVITAGTGGDGLELAKERVPDLVLLDLMLPDMSGIQVLGGLKSALPHICVVMITAYRETDTAVQAMKLDAFDYVNKPINLDRLLKVVTKALASNTEARRRYRNQQHGDLFGGVDDVVPSQAPSMLEIYDIVRKIAGGESTTVLIEGESGAGKDVVANLIHRTSLRKDCPLLEINCAALPEQLLESELFGHEKGAFTGAAVQKKGLLELAHSGTIFLDEIGEMALPVQVKLLRVLEKMNFRRVGGVEDISVDVRIVAATNRNLEAQVKAGSFREDLYFRLNVVKLVVPPLRERVEDILPLVDYFLGQFNLKFNKSFTGLDDEARQALLGYAWPGNIRELKNMLERSVLLGSGEVLRRDDFQVHPGTGQADDLGRTLQDILRNSLPEEGVDLEGLVNQIEESLVRKALAEAGGNQSEAARLVGLNRDKFRYRLKQYDLKES